LDTIEKQREKESLIQKLNLTSDMFVSKVLEDFASLEEVLELLTGKHYHIVDIRTQYAIRQLVTHSVQLDVYAEEESGSMVHLEIQNRDVKIFSEYSGRK
jgi:penicillin V acylase-like amidase (Ntn superfamily)